MTLSGSSLQATQLASDLEHSQPREGQKEFPYVEVDGIRFSAEYRFSDASIFVKVEDQVYALHASILQKCSAFKDLATLPLQPEGATPQTPLELSHTTSTKEWLYFLDFLYNTPEDRQPLEFYLAILRLGTIWDHSWYRDYAISKLSNHPDLLLPRKVNIALKYQIYSWLKPAFKELCSMPLSYLSQDDVALLGSDFFYRLVQTHSKLLYERTSIAYSEPSFKWAGNSCTGSKEDCQEGWKDAWWTYGSRMLLHPDYPKKGEEVAKDLLGLRDVEGICNSCWNSTVSRLLSQSHLIESHLDTVISEAGDDLIPVCRYILNREIELA